MLLEANDLDMDGSCLHGFFCFCLRLTVWVGCRDRHQWIRLPFTPSRLSHLSQSFNYDHEEIFELVNIFKWKLNWKFLELVKYYNFVLGRLSIRGRWKIKKNQNLRTWNILLGPQMISNKKIINFVDPIEIYNFDIKFVYIRLCLKKS